jgi:TolA-binding protein
MRFNYSFLSAGLVALAACSSTAPPYVALPIRASDPGISNVEVTEATLYEIVRVGAPTVKRIKGTNQLEVTVPILNIHHEQIQIHVQVSFLDHELQPIGDETNKQTKLVSPGETVTHTATSRKAEAQDWIMRISWDF